MIKFLLVIGQNQATGSGSGFKHRTQTPRDRIEAVRVGSYQVARVQSVCKFLKLELHSQPLCHLFGRLFCGVSQCLRSAQRVLRAR